MTTATDPALPRLLLGNRTEPLTSLDAHTKVYGPLPDLCSLAPTAVIELAERSGLRGHGGASFPMARKLQTVASRRGSKIVVANGTEGEPASKKDRALMRQLPHLILDGAAVAAHAVGAEEAIIAFSEDDVEAFSSLDAAVRARTSARRQSPDPRFQLAGVPDHFVSGQETALVNLLSGGEAKPTFGTRPFERGVRRAPTLVQNVETLSHLALIARHGADWFRRLGPAEDPGSALITLSGAVGNPGVYEIEHGMPLPELLHTAGVAEPLRAILLGGYFGSWLPASEIPSLELAPRRLAAFGASFGAGIIIALGHSACPVAETARIADYLATESAGQCGPCVNGLGAIADTVQQLATGTAGHDARRDLAGPPSYRAAAHASTRTAPRASSPAGCGYSARSSVTTPVMVRASAAPPGLCCPPQPRRSGKSRTTAPEVLATATHACGRRRLRSPTTRCRSRSAGSSDRTARCTCVPS